MKSGWGKSFLLKWILCLISNPNVKFDKYIDEIALIKISQQDDIFIGWFFSITDELNLYSNKIYEVTLKSCSTEN